MHCNRVQARDPRNRSPVEVLMQLADCRTLSIRAPYFVDLFGGYPAWKAGRVA